MATTQDGGVLSQTLTPGPCIKAILSARIRNPMSNDVVMVGYSSIHLREFTQSGQLTNVIAELELGVQILAAKVVSAEAYLLPLQDAILENGRDEVRFRVRGKTCEDDQPPQIVVLSVASSEFIFLYAKDLPNGEVQFIAARRSILGNLPLPRAYGKHLAIDKSSRALAVAAHKGSFGIMSLKDVDEIKRDIDNWDPRDPMSLRPIKEQRFVQVDGVIIRMDFLKSSSHDPNRLVLLLIVANQGVTRLLLYKWDSTRSLSTLKPLQRSGYQLPKSDAFPHLLIPSCRQASFAIVVGQDVVFYDDVESKKIRRLEVKLEVTADLDSDKQWVQWAKPVRHEEHRKRKEDIFIVREDGLLRTVIGVHDLAKRQSITIKPGHLGINVDTAVCALSAPPTVGGDILIACGDTTEGGVFHLAALAKPSLLQVLPNWSPINDFIHLQRASAASLPDHSAIVAATGVHEGRSALTELRYGIEADMMWTSKYDEARTIDRIWTLTQPFERKLLLLASHHEHSTLLTYDVDSGEITAVDAALYPHICFDQATLTANTIASSVVVQIATKSVNITGPDQATRQPATDYSVESFFCADIYEATGIWVAAGRQGDSVVLTGGCARINEMDAIETSEVPKPLRIDSIPVALTTFSPNGRLLCLVAVQDGGMYLYEVHPEDGFRYQGSWTISELYKADSGAQISSISALFFEDSSSSLIVCGLKTGNMIFLDLAISNADTAAPTLQYERSILLGTTAVHVRAESTVFMDIERAAHVVCGSNLSRVVLHRNQSGLDFTISPIYVADRGASPNLPASITAIDRVGRFFNLVNASENDPSGALVVVSGEDLSMLTIGPSIMLPRHIRSTGTTKHLIYAPLLGKYIVSSQNRSSTKPLSPHSERPALIVVDPKGPSAGDDLTQRSTAEKTFVHFGEKGEKVRLLMHWMPTDGNIHYNMVVIGSDLDKVGHISYIHEGKMSSTQPSPSAKVVGRYRGSSINALCAYDKSSLIVGAGRDLKILHLDMSKKKWTHRGKFELPSRAVELKSKGHVVYAATSLHSFMLIRVSEDQSRMELIGSDKWASKARNILTYGDKSTLVNLISDHGSRILNFTDRPTEGTRPTFEVRLPQVVDKIAHLKLSSTSDTRNRFLGTTICGAVYLFTTLTEPEMKLMRLLEQLCEPMRLQSARNASQLAQAIAHRYANRLESADIAAPMMVSTHAKGDVLRALLSQGSYNIRCLLQKRAKLEDELVKQEDELEGLKYFAGPVVGNVEDVVDGVILWLRRILNVPAFS